SALALPGGIPAGGHRRDHGCSTGDGEVPSSPRPQGAETTFAHRSMKTLRELLLSRHRAATPKLAAQRKALLQQMCRAAASPRHEGEPQELGEWLHAVFGPLRR